MMTFKEQIKWIEDKITELDNNDEESLDSKVLKQILYDYKQAKERSIELSWYKSPESMGK